MFSLARALSSSASVEDRSSLFGRFTGTTARSDSSGTCLPAVRLIAFSDRSRSWLDREVPEISRFSCMLFLSVRGFLDYAEPTGHSRVFAASHVAFSVGDGIGDSELTFRSSITRPTDALVYASTATSRRQPQDSGQDGFASPFL